jgi:hypothetical protein
MTIGLGYRSDGVLVELRAGESKVRMSDGATLTLERMRVEAQPADLFAVPAGYRKSDVRALIERIKHSDVWVEPPK